MQCKTSESACGSPRRAHAPRAAIAQHHVRLIIDRGRRAFNTIRHSVIRSATPSFQEIFLGTRLVPAQNRYVAFFIYSRYCSRSGTLRAVEQCPWKRYECQNGTSSPLGWSIALNITPHLQRPSCITRDLPVAVPIGVLAGEGPPFGDA